MRILSKLSLLVAGFVLVSLSSIVVVAAAPNSHANAAATDTTVTTNPPTNPGSQGATKLADAKLKACQRRQATINNIMSRIADRGQKQLDLFSSIADKTETFYTDKGKTLSNYDALVADVAAKKTAAQAVVDTIKSDSVTFKCDGTDPKGAAASFKDALKSEITALKNYKTSVKNLIVGVKSVQSTTVPADSTTTGGSRQ
jgi:hypothetical protein